MPSESREYIKPFLGSIRDKYEKPLAVVRDMSEEIADSVSEVFPWISQQVCHYHFVRNLGDIIFKHLYQEFRREILKTNILARILALKKICMDGISSQDRIVIAEHYWVMLAIEYVLYPRERKSDYPFVLPYLEVMNRLMEVLDMLKKIREEGRKREGEYAEISKRILQNCHDHMDELFVKVKDINGEEIRIVRNNGVEELNHRWSRMHIRRRTGRSRTTMEMEKYGAVLAVFSNIENEEYIKTVLGDVKDFVREMQEVTESEIFDAKRLIRTFPQSPLIRSDSERPGILREFIRLVDDAFEDVLDRDVEGWLSNFQTDAIMTP